MPTTIIVHERIAEWIGRLRPRFAADSIRWVESRSTADLVAATRNDDRAIILINLAGRTHWGMASLAALDETPHGALILVLDPDRVPAIPSLARELGATLVLTGVAVPPQVEAILRRFLRVLSSPPGPPESPSPSDSRHRPAPTR